LGYIAFALALILVGGLFFLLFMLFNKPLLLGLFLASVLLIAALIGLVYLSSWFQLAQVLSVVQNSSHSLGEVFKKTRPVVLPFIIFSFLNGLFMFGLLYTNILFFIPALLWAVWGVFSVYSFLDGHRLGLMPLWHSRSKINGHFLKVLGYYAILLAVFFIFFGLTVSLNENLKFYNGIVYFLITPFVISYGYEIYQSLPEPTSVNKPKAWLGLSIIGWVLFGLLIIFTTRFANKNIKHLFNQNFSKQLEKTLKQQKELLPETPVRDRGNVM